MATATYLYTPEQTVWVIGACGVEKGTVKDVLISVTQAAGTVITYSVKIDGIAGESLYFEADTFGTKADALTEYGTRVQS